MFEQHVNHRSREQVMTEDATSKDGSTRVKLICPRLDTFAV